MNRRLHDRPRVVRRGLHPSLDVLDVSRFLDALCLLLIVACQLRSQPLACCMASVPWSRFLPGHCCLCMAVEHGRTRALQKKLDESSQDPLYARFAQVRGPSRRHQLHLVCLLPLNSECTLNVVVRFLYDFIVCVSFPVSVPI